MTEKEKLLYGELYSGDDRELTDERIRAKKMCADYNSCPYNDFTKKRRLIEKLFG